MDKPHGCRTNVGALGGPRPSQWQWQGCGREGIRHLRKRDSATGGTDACGLWRATEADHHQDQ
eukprot:354091-Amphidinium_carterae.2